MRTARREGFETRGVPARLALPRGWLPERELVVPTGIWKATWRAFDEYARQNVECPAVWHGFENDATKTDVVTTLTVPDAQRETAYYQIEESATQAMARACRAAGTVALAQIHTHPPSCSVMHSSYDDANALSLGAGFLSIVFPDYGRSQAGVEAVGVHERIPGRWVLLDAALAARRLRFAPSVLDLRNSGHGTAPRP